MRRLPRFLPWAGVALVLVLVTSWLALRGPSADEADWVQVRRDDLVIGVELEGTLKAVDSIMIGPPQIEDLWDYKISNLAAEGSDVKAGDPVLSFDTSELERRLDEKQAESASAQKEIEKREIDLNLKRRDLELQLAEAEAKKHKAQLKVDRPEELAAASELGQARLDLQLAEREIQYLNGRMDAERRAAKAEMASLRVKHDRASERVREIESAVKRMTVTAPRPGTVVYVTGWRDDKKKVGDSCWRGEKVLEVPDLARMKAEGEVDEADAGKIRIGQPVTLRLDAHPELEFKGSVRSIWGTVQRKSWNNPVKVVRLDIELERTDSERMRPGMRFTGTIETDRVAGALVVPAEAVFPTPEGPIAWRRTRLGAEQVSLDLGKRSAKSFEVKGGLGERDEVSRRNLGRRDRPS